MTTKIFLEACACTFEVVALDRQKNPVGHGWERSELVAEPERTIVRVANRFDIEVTTGQQAPALDLRIDRNAEALSDMAKNSPFDVRNTDEKPSTGCVPTNGGTRPFAGVIS